MGLFKKKDKHNKSNRLEESFSEEFVKETPNQRSSARANLDARKIEDVDSSGLSPRAVKSDLYSPSGVTEDSSMLSGDSKTEDMIDMYSTPTRGKDTRGPWFTSRQIRLFRKPPPAEQAAYSGPPRYDWVDIETSAAIKVQAAYRRMRVLSMMEQEGHSTAAARNLARRRRAAREATSNPAQDFINLFNCCGVDLGLGGGNKESYFDITRELETARYNETKREKFEHEEQIRKKYQRKPPSDNLVENVEVVQ